MDNDNGLRDAIRSFILHFWCEAINKIGKKAEAAGAVQVGDCTVHSKEELIEGMVDYHFEEGRLAEVLKEFHEKHGFYPPLPDLSKLPRFSYEPRTPKARMR